MPEMKDSGIEWIREIPTSWTRDSIKYHYQITLGKMVNTTVTDETKLSNYLCAANVKWPGVNTDVNKKMFFSEPEKSQYLLKLGDILIMEGGTAGTTCIYRGEFSPCYIQNSVLRCRPTGDNCARFLYFWMYVVFYSGYVMATCNKATIMHYTKEKIESTPIAIPCYEEQSRIADFLDSKCSEIDDLAADIQKEIDILEEYKRSVIFDKCTHGLNSNVEVKKTDSDVWTQIPDGWKLVDIKYLFEIVKRIAGKEGYDVLSVTQKGLKVKDITSGDGQLADDYSGYQFVYPTDYVMNHMDLLTGWVDLSDKFGVTSPDYRVFRLRDKKSNSLDYYKYIMQCCYMNRIFYSLGQGVSNLGRWRLQTSSFNNFKVPVPEKKEQEEIAEYLNNTVREVDATIEEKKQQRSTLEEYKKSLIYEYVTGKKEVPHAEKDND